MSARAVSRLIAFALALTIAAAVTPLAAHFVMKSVHSKGMRRCSATELRSAPFDRRVIIGFMYTGADSAGNHPDQLWLQIYTNGQIIIRPSLGHGEGNPAYEGALDPKTGRFDIGLWNACQPFREVTRIRGVLRGPALVDGTPSVYLDAWAWSEVPEKLLPEWRGPRHWRAVLKAGGW